MAIIGFDARALEPGFKSHFGRGTGRYAAELLHHLHLLQSDSLSILPLSSDQLSAHGWQRTVIELLPFGRQTAETQLFLPRRLEALPVDMIHFMAHGDATARCRKPYIVTVLDLIPLRFPDLYQAKKSNWRFRLARALEERAIRAATGILAISEATKRDVVELLGIDPQRIIVTPLGVSSDYQPRPPDPTLWAERSRGLRDRYGIGAERPILVYVGGIDPRKNVLFLLRVFAELCRGSEPGRRPVLFLVGRHEDDDQYPGVVAERERLGVVEDVKLVGYLADREMLDLYAASHVKLFPSIYEGFGLPVLEAMALGVPVVAGNNSSIPEVAGDAAVLLDVTDREAWVREIRALLNNPERQRDLSERGVRQAARFTWHRTAELTRDAYQRFLRR